MKCYLRDGALVHIVRVITDRRHGEMMMMMVMTSNYVVIIIIIITGLITLRRAHTHVRSTHDTRRPPPSGHVV